MASATADRSSCSAAAFRCTARAPQAAQPSTGVGGDAGSSLPGASGNPDSPLALDLTVDRNVVTGTWVEQTSADCYDNGARYHGGLQMPVEPTGRRMAGKWVGFGKDFDVNTGPWELRLTDRSTSKATLERYGKPPE